MRLVSKILCNIVFEHDPLDGRVFYKEACSEAEAGFVTYMLVPTRRKGMMGKKSNHTYKPGLVVNNVHFLTYAYPDWLPHGWLRNLVALCSIRRVLRKLNPHICVFHEDTFTIISAMTLHKFLPQAKLVFDFHEAFLHRFRINTRKLRLALHYLRCENAILEQADLLVGVSDWFVEYYSTLTKVPVISIHNAQSAKIFVPHAQPELEEAFWVVHEGHFSFDRGLRQLVEIAGIINEPKIRFLIIGNLPTKEAEFFNQQPQAIRDKFHVTGFLPYKKVPDYLAKAKVGVILNQSANQATGLPNKFFNYVRFGLPMVVTPNHMLDKFIGQYGLGLIGKDTSTQAAHILSLYHDEQLYNRFAQQVQQAFEQELNWEANAAKLIGALQQL